MIVTGPHIRQLDWCQDILREIESCVESAVIFDDVTPNPKDFEAMRRVPGFLSRSTVI